MQLEGNKIFAAVVGLLGLVAALFFGFNIADGRHFELIVVAAAVMAVVWTIVGQRIWWLPMFLAMSLGGFFYLGFRIYSVEAAVLVCVLPLVLAWAIKKHGTPIMPIPWVLIILFGYLCLHYISLVTYNQVSGEGGLGNITRRYATALYPFFVLIPFFWTANLRYLPWVLHLVAIGTLIRFSLAFAFVFTERTEFTYVPIINFVPPSGATAHDLRFSGSMLATVAICYFCLSRNFIVKILLSLVILVAIWGTFLGGGRVTIVLLFGLFGFAFLVYKNYPALAVWAAGVFTLILFVNSNPHTLYSFHPQIMRAGSAMLLDREMAAQMVGVSKSDEWHARLQEAGWESWTESFLTILVGRGVGRFEERAWLEGENFEGMVEMATVTSRFEKGLWDVLATFGIVGFALYTVLLWKVLRECIPILFRERISSPTHAILFIASYSCLSWFLLCWLTGSFPSPQVLFGVVALAGAHQIRIEKEPPPRSKIRHFASDGLAEEHLHVPHVRKRVLGGPANHS